MRMDVLTIFPKMFPGVLSESLLGKAREKGLVDLRVQDIREHAEDKHRTVDDRPYGGGPGMVMKPEPLLRALRAVGVPEKKGKTSTPFVIYLSPQGVPLTQSLADDLARKKRLVFLCGHYEGVDERIFDWIDLEVSIGDVVLTGGEIPAMAVLDAVARKVPGVVKEPESLLQDSFAPGWEGHLDCPHYTRPAEWRGRRVPDVLLQGHHEAIQAWRAEQSLRRTRQRRPDLLRAEHTKRKRQ
ncbi:MAG: tRNA (guanosine(37)-N1)-methyltransferase TrmD [Elusimicrobia bacterium]|nr:tRNA (guanosine(37)-N1)-methyltransferase TrmD [Elusimicrobiota bacterium]